jgi:hypothetical protein
MLKSAPTMLPETKMLKEVDVKPKVDKVAEQAVKPNEVKPVNQTDKVVPKTEVKGQVDNRTSSTNNAMVATATVQQKLPDVPLFKNLFAYRANEPHFVALYIFSGTVDFAKVKTELDAYNAKNYGVMNLKVSLEKVDKQQVLIIGSIADANVAKSYLLRFVKEKGQFEGLKNVSYRNLLGSQSNLNIMMQQNALNVYFEFMQQYYLK